MRFKKKDNSRSKRRKTSETQVHFTVHNGVISNARFGSDPAKTSDSLWDTNDNSDTDSESNCFICGQAGELIICDHANCTKVYHVPCLPISSPPTDEAWYW